MNLGTTRSRVRELIAENERLTAEHDALSASNDALRAALVVASGKGVRSIVRVMCGTLTANFARLQLSRDGAGLAGLPGLTDEQKARASSATARALVVLIREQYEDAITDQIEKDTTDMRCWLAAHELHHDLRRFVRHGREPAQTSGYADYVSQRAAAAIARLPAEVEQQERRAQRAATLRDAPSVDADAAEGGAK